MIFIPYLDQSDDDILPQTKLSTGDLYYLYQWFSTSGKLTPWEDSKICKEYVVHYEKAISNY